MTAQLESFFPGCPCCADLRSSRTGNHCLYNLPRARLNQLLDIPENVDGCSYYSFQPHPSFR